MSTPILFLDIDGVVNSAAWFGVLSKRGYRRTKGKAKADAGLDLEQYSKMIDPSAVGLLNSIVFQSGAVCVLSSSWRIPWSHGQVEWMLVRRGFIGRVIDATPKYVEHIPAEHYERGHEIGAWLNAHDNAAPFAILDDSDDMAHLLPWLVRTTWERGLEAEHVERVVALLSRTP